MKGKDIKELRKRHHMSQKELAERIGVTRQTISLWENEVCDPGFENLHAICDVFHIQSGLFEDEIAVASTEPERKISIFWLVLGILGLLFLVAVLVIVFVTSLAIIRDSKLGNTSENYLVFGISPLALCIIVAIVLAITVASFIFGICKLSRKNKKKNLKGKKGK